MPKTNKHAKIFFISVLVFGIIYILGIVIFSRYIKSKIAHGENISGQNTWGVVVIANKKIDVEIVSTPELRYHGLSDRNLLCDDCGMLFLFADKAERKFVMRDMRFDLDIIWIADGEIIGMSKNLPKEGHDPQTVYSSDAPADRVLEVNSGFCDRNNINVGDEVEIYD